MWRRARALSTARSTSSSTVRAFVDLHQPILSASAASAASAVPFEISGWVRSVRVHKHVSFVSIYDGTTTDALQVVLPTAQVRPLTLQGLNTGASVTCTGTASLSRQGKVDMTGTSVQLVGASGPAFPIQKKDHTTSFLRDEALHHRHRTEYMSAVLRVRSAVGAALRQGLEDDGFEWISTPVLTSNDCEGAGELFQLQANRILPRDTYLTVSGQLHSEIFVSGGFKAVYTFGPTFRAENSQTTRHLCEFWMCEPEMAFATGADAAASCERLIKHVFRQVHAKRQPELLHLQQPEQPPAWAVDDDKPFAHMTFAEAVRVLEQKKAALPILQDGLSTAQERYLTEEYCQGVPLFVSQFPAHCKPFYCLQDEATGLADNFDLLVPGIGELVGGSAREHRYDVLEQRMLKLGLLPQLQWYLDLRKFGTTPHAGYGIGFERLVQLITGVENIRDVSPIPRFPSVGPIKF